MTESEKEELRKKALAVLKAMKVEPDYFFDSFNENILGPIKRDLEKSEVYWKLFPGDRKRDLEDKNLFNDRMNCIAKAQERFHSNGFVGLKKFNEIVRCKVTFNEKAVSDDVQEFRDRLEHARFKYQKELDRLELDWFKRFRRTFINDMKERSHKENHQ